MLQRWLRICWKWSTFSKVCKKQDIWDCWTGMGSNQQRLSTERVRTRSSSGDSKNYCVWDFDTKFIPWLVLPEQEEHRPAVANDSIQTTTNEPDFLKKVITLKETEVSLSFVQYFLYLLSFSITISSFHITWLDTFWADLIYILNLELFWLIYINIWRIIFFLSTIVHLIFLVRKNSLYYYNLFN